MIIASTLIGTGVFAGANYYIEHTTVTIESVAWAESYGNGATGYIASCGFGLYPNCPQHVKPGSDYTTSITISGAFSGKNVNLSAPSPFHLVSTVPSLPALVPSSGLVLTVDLGLPSSPGEYSFTGAVTFT